MIYTAIDNFYVTEEQLEDTPSRRDGVPRDKENQLRIYGCDVIQEGGILLKLPQAVMATAQVLLQRFYVKQSMLKYNIKILFPGHWLVHQNGDLVAVHPPPEAGNVLAAFKYVPANASALHRNHQKPKYDSWIPQRVAWACCWLATKLEENPRRIRDLLAVFNRVDQRREGKSLQILDLYGQEYVMFKKELLHVERIMLRTFGFVLHVDHPHKFVLNYLNILKAGPELKQEAWNLANDSLRTTLSVRYRGETVACGLIFLAARRLQEPLPEDPAWWDLFKVNKADMYEVARQVNVLFTMPKVQYISVHSFSSKQLQSPKGSETAKDPAVLSSSATATGTPMPYEHDSDTGASHPKQISEGSGQRDAENQANEAIETDAKPPDSHKKEKRRRGKHEKRHESDDEESEKRRRRYRRKDAHDAEHSDQEERVSKRDREASWKRDKRGKEDRDRDFERRDRSRERDRLRDYRDRRRNDRDRS